MERISHSHVPVRGLKLHVAVVGSGSRVVLFLHGFPEIWYTWRHQMLGVAKAGYRALAIDHRGYGDSDMPPEPEKNTFSDLVDDIIALLDTLGIPKVFLVAKDFAAIAASLVAATQPDRVAGFITLGVPFLLPGPNAVRLDLMPSGFYIARWQEPGRAEADFGRLDVKTVIRKIYILFSGTEPPTAGDVQEIMDLVDESTPLPPWFSEDDLQVYASLYENSGFRLALQVPYRKLGVDAGIKEPKVRAPGLLIMGEKDYVLKFAGIEDYIRSGKVKHFVPDLDIIFIEKGTHFVHEQFPQYVNNIIITFLNNHTP